MLLIVFQSYLKTKVFLIRLVNLQTITTIIEHSCMTSLDLRAFFVELRVIF